MSTGWLANAHPESFWPNHTWTGFAALSGETKARMLVVLPIHGIADHGLGLPLDAEEIAGGEILRRVVSKNDSLRVLPPLRFALAPYPSARFGVDAETAHGQLCEIARSVKAAGFRRILFFNTSPWNEEMAATVALDTRVGLGLESHVVNLSQLGMSFHPGASREARANAQAAAAYALGLPVETIADNVRRATKADVRDADFRPGNFQQPEPLAPDDTLDGETILEAAAMICAAQASSLLPECRLEACATTLRAPAFPSGYRKNYLPALTAGEFAAIPQKNRALVIIPTGAIEQHGPHLPVGVDAMLGQAWLAHALPKLSQAAARRVFVAPPVTFGKSNEHDGFPGTITVSAKTLRRVLFALATELHAMGFRNLAVLNTHGGNSAVLVYTLREIQTVLGLRAGMIKPPMAPEISAKEAELGIHAGEWETALMLACAPELVRMDEAVCEYPSRLLTSQAWMTRDVSKSGVMGDASAATPEKGGAWLEKASAALAKRIGELLD